jgi:hypothetical protein
MKKGSKKIIAPLRGLEFRGHLDPALRRTNNVRLRLGYQYLALRAEFIIFILPLSGFFNLLAGELLIIIFVWNYFIHASKLSIA